MSRSARTRRSERGRRTGHWPFSADERIGEVCHGGGRCRWGGGNGGGEDEGAACALVVVGGRGVAVDLTAVTPVDAARVTHRLDAEPVAKCRLRVSWVLRHGGLHGAQLCRRQQTSA